MNIAIIGYGRMGHEIESAAVSRGHEIKLVIDKENPEDFNQIPGCKIDVAIEFTTPETACGNISKCLEMEVPVVSGTTGWLKDYDRMAEICRKNNTSFIHSSNFSVGVNILFRINSELARLMAQYPEYKPFIEEIHHVKKLDAPSGTAIEIAKEIMSEDKKYTGWCFEDEKKEGHIPIQSVREGLVPGIHRVTWDSDSDTLSLRHESKGRKGLALGAVIAAEYIKGRKGIFTMNDVLGF